MKDYYSQIKEQIINNEITKQVKNYSINKSDLTTYYNIGKLLNDAGKHYGESIIKKYSIKLTNEFGKKYNVRYLFDMKKLYEFAKVHPLDALLNMYHYRILFSLKDNNEIDLINLLACFSIILNISFFILFIYSYSIFSTISIVFLKITFLFKLSFLLLFIKSINSL